MALNTSAHPHSSASSSSSNRRWHWGPLHSWNIFSSRFRRSRPPSQPHPTRNHRSRPLRRRNHNEIPLSNPSSSSSTYTGMVPADSPRRRRTTARRADTIETTSWNRHRSRTGTNTTNNQHHHYHHHYHHYQLSPPTRGNPDRGTALTLDQGSGSIFSENEHTSRSVRSRDSGRYSSAFFSRFSFTNEPHEAAREARERLDERLRASALTSNRRNFSDRPAIFPDDFDFIFEDEDIWSDDEIWEIGMRDWLAAWNMEERWSAEISPDRDSKTLGGMSKAQLNNLAREVFVPYGSITEKEFKGNETMASEQEDCPVCLEHFLPGQTLFCLPCKHRFHLDCLSPWLESHAQCPYCRAVINCEDPVHAGSSTLLSSDGIIQGEEDFLSWMTVVDSSLSRLNFYSD